MMMMKSVFLVEETGVPGGNHRRMEGRKKGRKKERKKERTETPGQKQNVSPSYGDT